jgi:hypothetical protein
MLGIGRSGSFWPTIDSPAKAVDVMHYGAYVAALGALLTAGISIQAIYLGRTVLGISGWALSDAALFSIIAWRVYRLSLPWSIVGLIMFAFEKLIFFTHHLNLSAVIFTIFIFPYYLNAVRGALYLQSASAPAPAPVAIAEATLDDHEAFRQYMMQSHRPFRKSNRSVQEEFNLWLADRQKKMVQAGARAKTTSTQQPS